MKAEEILFSSCEAIDSATNCASTSGFFTSLIDIESSDFILFAKSDFSFSISEPFFPIMRPGFAECIRTRVILSLPVRSISIREIPAW